MDADYRRGESAAEDPPAQDDEANGQREAEQRYPDPAESRGAGLRGSGFARREGRKGNAAGAQQGVQDTDLQRNTRRAGTAELHDRQNGPECQRGEQQQNRVGKHAKSYTPLLLVRERCGAAGNQAGEFRFNRECLQPRVAIMPDEKIPPTADGARGRQAERPGDIPVRGWKDIVWRSWNDFGEKNLSLVAGGVTYYLILALFPGLAALVSLYGLIADPARIEDQLNSLSGLLPDSARQLMGGELHQLISASGDALGIGVVVGILLALWSASRGMSGMISALDIAYDRPERRGFFRFNMIALLLTVGLIIGGLIVVALIAGLPALLVAMGARAGTRIVALIVEWPVLMVFVIGTLAILYRYAPDRDKPKWQWISPGAVTATVVWIIASILFSVYASHFGNYNATYGSLGAIIVLLTWLWISVSAVLLGAEINAESERQARSEPD